VGELTMISIDLNDVEKIIAKKNHEGISFQEAALKVNAAKHEDVPKLKPCPFCCGEAIVRPTRYLGCYGYVVTCENCSVETRLMDTMNGAIWLWNRRADDGHKNED
jgi:Lar family restriction alleviation protein